MRSPLGDRTLHLLKLRTGSRLDHGGCVQSNTEDDLRDSVSLTDVRIERLDHGMVCGLIVKSKCLATTSIQCITWNQYSCQRITIHVNLGLYVCFANLIPLTFPHDGVHVTIGIYMFDPYVRFTIQVTYGLEHGVEGMLVVTRGTTVVHTAKDGTDPFMMSMLIICVCPQFGIIHVHLTTDHACL